MTEKDVIDSFAGLLDRAVSSAGFSIPVIQLQQPTQQARTDAGAVYFSVLHDDLYGWPGAKLEYNSVKDNFTQTETQHTILNLQVSVLLPQIPEESTMTPKDLAKILAARINSRNYRRLMQADKYLAMRITSIRQPWQENDREQFEAMPSFDVQLAYDYSITEEVPRIVELTGIVHFVPDNPDVDEVP